MSRAGLQEATGLMRAAGVDERAIRVFAHNYRQLEEGADHIVPEGSIAPLRDVPRLDDLEVDPAAAADALDHTAVIKLNGGLGTSMGLSRAKSLIPVRDGQTFLDVIVRQVRRARERHGARLPLLFMNSFRTRADTLAALAAHPDLPVPGVPLDFLQSQQPKLLADTLEPVRWPADPSLEWCPPGHGDLYPALLASGVLETLLGHGYRYAMVSNSDNLGAVLDGRVAGWFAGSGAPYAAEVCRRSPADRKGGHLAVARTDGSLLLRETAQTATADLPHFTDTTRHPWSHTNTLWLDLPVLHQVLQDRGGVLGLPLIRNIKYVDPTDPASPEVVQLETAMGAAIGVIEGATALGVGRDRFIPVKTTDDLLVVRSDVYRVDEDGILNPQVESLPSVDLDRQHYAMLAALDQRFPSGPPSLRRATSLTVRGAWTFGAGVEVRGPASLPDEGPDATVADGTVLGAGS